MTLQEVEIAVFTAGIVLGGFGSPLLAVFTFISREDHDEDTHVSGVILTLALTGWFFVTAFTAFAFAWNITSLSVQEYAWIPPVMLAGGCIFIMPLVWIAGYVKVGSRRSSPQTMEEAPPESVQTEAPPDQNQV